MQTSVEIDRKTLTIKLPLQEPVRSKSSGKTWVIATTHGAVTTDARFRGKRIVVVANAFVYPTKKHGHTVRARRLLENPDDAAHQK
jgi:hypothetical protein